jgi:23S rRNA (uracil1939-C5)-methyltransferase
LVLSRSSAHAPEGLSSYHETEMRRQNHSSPPPADQQTFNVLVERLNDEGFGVAQWQGHELWIQGGFPGERVLACAEREMAGKSVARILSILEVGPDRSASGPSCQPDCPGCPLLRLSYPAQLRFKQERVLQALKQVPNARSLDILPIRAADPQLGYRASAKLSVSVSGRRAKVGLFRWGTHSIPATTRCPTHHPLVNDIAEAVAMEIERQLAGRSTRAGAWDWLRHLVIRVSPVLGRAMVTFVVARPDRRLAAISKGLQRRIPEVVSLHENLNERASPQVFGAETRRLWGYPDLLDQVGERRVLLGPVSFFQAHHIQAALVYELVRQWAELGPGDSAVDIYCGVGGITMSLAQDAGRVIGVETSEAAVADARRNAALNGLGNCLFRVGDAARLTAILRLSNQPAVVTLNPPRSGAGLEVLRQVASLQPRRLVYVSCNPETLAADMRRLAGLGYVSRQAQPVDMFPQTPHVETVVSFDAVQ